MQKSTSIWIMLTCGLAAVVIWFFAGNNLVLGPDIEADAKNGARNLLTALRLYHLEYQESPFSDRTEDVVVPSAGHLIAVLSGATGTSENPREKKFFEAQKARGMRDGIWGETSLCPIVFDPWGRPYVILVDCDGDGMVTHPKTGEVIEDTVAIYSQGIDIRDPGDDHNSWQ